MINDEILEIISDVVSEYADNHWHSDDFDSQRQRVHYLEEIAEGNGWNDEVEDEVYGELEGQTWEDENGVEHVIDLTDPDVQQAISDAVCEEAEYWLD
jgi:hypothetical protein